MEYVTAITKLICCVLCHMGAVCDLVRVCLLGMHISSPCLRFIHYLVLATLDQSAYIYTDWNYDYSHIRIDYVYIH